MSSPAAAQFLADDSDGANTFHYSLELRQSDMDNVTAITNPDFETDVGGSGDSDKQAVFAATAAAFRTLPSMASSGDHGEESKVEITERSRGKGPHSTGFPHQFYPIIVAMTEEETDKEKDKFVMQSLKTDEGLVLVHDADVDTTIRRNKEAKKNPANVPKEVHTRRDPLSNATLEAQKSSKNEEKRRKKEKSRLKHASSDRKTCCETRMICCGRLYEMKCRCSLTLLFLAAAAALSIAGFTTAFYVVWSIRNNNNESSNDPMQAAPSMADVGTPAPQPRTASPTSMMMVPPDESSYLELSLRLDRYPEDTAWSLSYTDQLRTELYGTSPADYATFLPYQSILLYLPVELEKKFVFVIYDSVGDGICCSFGDGQYRLSFIERKNDGAFSSPQDIAFGGIFGDMEETTFAISAAGTVDILTV